MKIPFFLFSAISREKGFCFAPEAFIKPVMAACSLSSLILGSSGTPHYPPVSFVSRQPNRPAALFMSFFSTAEPSLSPDQTNSRATNYRNKAFAGNVRNSNCRTVVTNCRTVSS
jgi:hypothetical protein